MEKKETTGLVWFGNDLRVHDNEVLSIAIKNHTKVIGVYCIDPSLFLKNEFGFNKMDVFRTKFLLETLEDLQQQLIQLNITLLVFKNHPENKILDICKTYQIECIYKQKEWTNDEVISLKSVKEILTDKIKVHEIYNQFLYHPDDINISIENIPPVFSNLRKKLEKYNFIRPEVHINKLATDNLINEKTKIPSLEDLGFEEVTSNSKSAFPFHGGESEGLKRLHNYFFETKKLGFYKKTRNGLIGTDYSSKLIRFWFF